MIAGDQATQLGKRGYAPISLTALERRQAELLVGHLENTLAEYEQLHDNLKRRIASAVARARDNGNATSV